MNATTRKILLDGTDEQAKSALKSAWDEKVLALLRDHCKRAGATARAHLIQSRIDHIRGS